MSDDYFLDMWGWEGRVGRARYLVTGLVLFALKHNIDRLLAAGFGYPLSPLSYWVFIAPDGIFTLKPADGFFYSVLLLFAIPFIWIGTVMTLRRLRDAGLPL